MASFIIEGSVVDFQRGSIISSALSKITCATFQYFSTFPDQMCKFCSKYINSAFSTDIDFDVGSNEMSPFVIGGVDRKEACVSFLSRFTDETTKSRPLYEVEFRCDEDDLKDSQVTEESESSGFKVPSNLMFNLKSKKKSKRLRLDQIDRLEASCSKAIRGMFLDTEDLFVRCIEIKCGLPGCPPLETVLFALGMEWSPSRMYIRRPLMEVSDVDVSTVVRELWSKWRQWELRRALGKQ